jgi:hypothetical protein
MIKLNKEVALFAIIVIGSMLIIATALAGPAITALAVKKSGGSVQAIHKTPNKITTIAAHTHIRGVKLLSAHTIPSKIAVGNRFSMGVTVFNNSSSTITFANGTCTSSPSPLSIAFNRNAMIEPQAPAVVASCKATQVALKPGEHSQIKTPNIYAATAPGTTNATMIFKYGAETPITKSPINDTTSRTYGFDILPSAGSQSTTTTSTTPALKPSSPKIAIP